MSLARIAAHVFTGFVFGIALILINGDRLLKPPAPVKPASLERLMMEGTCNGQHMELMVPPLPLHGGAEWKHPQGTFTMKVTRIAIY